jgi:hypothetical protein
MIQQPMRAWRVIVAILTVVVSGYLLLMANGVSGAMAERTHGWQITPLPIHPAAHIAVYLSCAIGLQFLSAWFLMPANVEKGTRRFWSLYGATVAVFIGGSLVAAFFLAFVVMALLDAGLI